MALQLAALKARISAAMAAALNVEFPTPPGGAGTDADYAPFTDAAAEGIAEATLEGNAYYSLSVLLSGTPTTGEFNPLLDTNWAGNNFREATEWQQNATGVGVTFDENTGLFTVPALGTGTYKIDVNWFHQSSSGTGTSDFLRVKVNSTIVWEADSFARSIVDPVERTTNILLDLAASDTVGVAFLPLGTSNINVVKGFTVTIEKKP